MTVKTNGFLIFNSLKMPEQIKGIHPNADFAIVLFKNPFIDADRMQKMFSTGTVIKQPILWEDRPATLIVNMQ